MTTTAHMYLSWGRWSLLQPRASLSNNTISLFKKHSTHHLLPLSTHILSSKMGEGPTVAIVRGLKVHIRVLDNFFRSNGCHTTQGIPPFYNKDPVEFSTLLRSTPTVDNNGTRLFILEGTTIIEATLAI